MFAYYSFLFVSVLPGILQSVVALLMFVPIPTSFSTLSLHDALPILSFAVAGLWSQPLRHRPDRIFLPRDSIRTIDRKSTRLNSSHQIISYAVFFLKKKIDLLMFVRIHTSYSSVTWPLS